MVLLGFQRGAVLCLLAAAALGEVCPPATQYYKKQSLETLTSSTASGAVVFHKLSCVEGGVITHCRYYEQSGDCPGCTCDALGDASAGALVTGRSSCIDRCAADANCEMCLTPEPGSTMYSDSGAEGYPGQVCAVRKGLLRLSTHGWDFRWLRADMAAAVMCETLTPCEAGTADSGAPAAGEARSADRTCDECVAGRFSAGGSAAACAPCPAGQFSLAKASGCTACEAGQFAAAAAAAACEGCAAGQVQPSSGQAACTACAAGRFEARVGIAAAPCTACAVGQFAAQAGLAACSVWRTCTAGEGAAVAANATSDVRCAACTAPGAGQDPRAAGGSYSKDVDSAACAPVTVCEADEYQSTAPTATSDRLCSTFKHRLGCPVGQKQTAAPTATADRVCQHCEAGRYNEEDPYVLPACKLCLAGQTSKSIHCGKSGEGSEVCFQAAECASCAKGKYAAAGDPGCTKCAAGKKGPFPGQPSCAACEAGQHQPSLEQEACLLCAAGQYQGSPASTECLRCPRGQHQPEQGHGTCNECPSGQHQAAEGQPACVRCAQGKYRDGVNELASAAEEFACKACAAGQAQNATGEVRCQECSAGRVQPAAAQLLCAACVPGMHQVAEGQTLCADCVDGAYQNRSAAAACVKCAAGKHRDVTAGNHEREALACAACGSGRYQDQPGADDCDACAAGKKRVANVAADRPEAQACVACGAGSHQNRSAQTDCSPCQAGRASPSAGASDCAVCAVGTHKPQLGAGACVNCTAGSVAATTGLAVCVNCTAGQLQAAEGRVACDDCPPGTFGEEGAAQCDACPPGRFAKEGGSAACESCPAGKFVEDNSVCTDCPSGKFMGAVGLLTCSTCPVGRFTYAAATSCQSLAQLLSSSRLFFTAMPGASEVNRPFSCNGAPDGCQSQALVLELHSTSTSCDAVDVANACASAQSRTSSCGKAELRYLARSNATHATRAVVTLKKASGPENSKMQQQLAYNGIYMPVGDGGIQQLVREAPNATDGKISFDGFNISFDTPTASTFGQVSSNSSSSYKLSASMSLELYRRSDGAVLDRAVFHAGTSQTNGFENHSTEIVVRSSPCGPGLECGFDGDGSQRPCKEGYHCSGGLVFRCRNGTYCPKGSSAPLPCGANALYCPGGEGGPRDVPLGMKSTGGEQMSQEQYEHEESSLLFRSAVVNCSAATHYCKGGVRSAVQQGFFSNETAPGGNFLGELPCPVGSYCEGGVKVECGPGFFCPAQSSAKTSCSKFDTYCQGGKTFPVDVGNYSMPLDDYAKPRTGQQMCEPGYSCTGGVRRLCSPGKNCSQPRTGEAQPCAAGFFCAATVSPDPQLCGDGYFCRAGSATRTPCPERFYCPAGSHQPIVCPIGSFCSYRSGNHTVCEDGFFCPAQSSKKASCGNADVYCAGGERLAVDVGNYSMPLDDDPKQRTGQQMCEPGYSCTGGVRSLCSPGKNCSQPRTGEAQPCAEGFFCNDENPSPQSCGDGYLCRTGAELPTACTPTRESAEDTYYGQFCAGGRLQTVRPGYYATPVDSSHAPLLNASSAAGEVAMVLLGGELPCGCNNGACPPASNWTTRDTVAGSNAPGLEMCCSAEAGYVCLGLGSDRGLRKAVSKGLKKVKATLDGELCGEGQVDCFAFSSETVCAKGSLCEAGEERECLDADGNPALCEEGVVKDGGCDESDQKVAQEGTCTACRPNHYALDGACASCPPREFAEACPVSGDNKTSFTLKAGFWFCTGQLSSNGTCFAETFVVNGSTQFIPCADGVSCAATRVEGLAGGLRSRWKMVCPEGTRGIGCAECDDEGYGKSVDGTCKLCPSRTTMLASGAAVFTAFAAFFFWFLKKSVHAPPDTEACGAAATKSGRVEEEHAHTAAMAVPRIITNHLYLTGLLKNLNVDWGVTLNSLFSFAKAASGNVPPFVDCAFGMTVFQTFRIYMMLPALAVAGPLAVLCAFVAVQKARRRFGSGGGGSGGKIRVLGTTVTHVFRTSVLILLYLLYPTIAQQSFQMLDCVTVMGTPYLRADVTQLCSGAEYDSNRSIALFVLATFVPAFPALIFGLMWRKRKRLAERKIQQRYLFLCACVALIACCCAAALPRPPACPPSRACSLAHSLTRLPPPPTTHTQTAASGCSTSGGRCS